MSNTIEARHYNAERASLLQRRPGAIIDTAESFHQVDPMQFHSGLEISAAGSYRMGAHLTGTTRTILVVGAAALFATSAIQTVTGEDFGTDMWARWSEASEAALQKARMAALEKAPPATKSTPSATAKLRVERLAALQAVLGLSIADLAQALALSRPGLYKWLDVSTDVKLQGASRERLAVIERIAMHWRERSTFPLGALAHEHLADGRTVFSMMTADQVNEAALIGAYDELVAKLAVKPKSRSQRLAEAGFKRRPSAKSLLSHE